jgi:hypothetical protein
MQTRRVFSLCLSFCVSLCLLASFGIASAPSTLASSQPTYYSPPKDSRQILPKKLRASAIPPLYTTSLYENTTDAATLTAQGCSSATGPAGIIVLDWGKPIKISQGVFGTYDFGGNEDSDNAIETAVTNFVQGVAQCQTSSTNLAIAIGESNYYNGNAIPLTQAAWSTDGMRWGTMVNEVQNYITTNHDNTIVAAYGAGDLEVEWVKYKLTKSLVDGYNLATSQLFFDFGDDSPGYWTNYQVWYVANGAKDNLPLPEIYYNTDATQDWEPLSVWACAHENRPLDFKGAMSTTVGNTPDEAFMDLYNAEQSNSCTASVISDLTFSTEILFAQDSYPVISSTNMPVTGNILP